MTFEQTRGIAKERMDKQISYLSADVITFKEALASLSAYYSVGLFTDVDYFDFLLRIRQVAFENL
ncbi:hypothetical protein [uncultured Ruminococcus sp.]|jgi:hypothetical protein|uniref:hypothetical protein n=1 Tax=uncultured Ruminococcus sp. TaxID=165186 RepID=UPI000E5075EA|nr:hypothetical protein [uncultured Ruminococcus sp.]